MKWSERRKVVEKVPSSMLVPVVVALTMAVAEGEIDAVVTVAAAVVEGIGPAVKTLF